MMVHFDGNYTLAKFDGNYTLGHVFCTIIWNMGAILWLILTDNAFEQFDENHDFDQIDGNYTLENYMEKGGSVGPLECKFMAPSG